MRDYLFLATGFCYFLAYGLSIPPNVFGAGSGAKPVAVTQYGCFAQSGDGGDALVSDIGGYSIPPPAMAVVVSRINHRGQAWPTPCVGQWIADNPDGYTQRSTPATMVLQRVFTVVPPLLSEGSFEITYGSDDEVIFTLSNSPNPAGVTIASCFAAIDSHDCKKCNSQVFNGDILNSSGPNTLTGYLINTFSGFNDGHWGSTGLYYSVCVSKKTASAAATQPPQTAPTPLAVTQFGYFAKSGDGGDVIVSDEVGFADPPPLLAVAVTNINHTGQAWPTPCVGQWIADNPDGYTQESTPTTMVFQRVFKVAPALLSEGSFEITYGSDDEVFFTLSNSLNPDGIIIASCYAPNYSHDCKACQTQAIHSDILVGSGPNTLTGYLINSFSGFNDGHWGSTGLYYAIDASRKRSSNP